MWARIWHRWRTLLSSSGKTGALMQRFASLKLWSALQSSNLKLVASSQGLLPSCQLGLHDILVWIMDNLPCNWNIFNSFVWDCLLDHLHCPFWNVLRNILLQMFNDIIIFLCDLSWHLLDHVIFSIVDDFSFFRDFLDSPLFLVLDNFFLERFELNFGSSLEFFEIDSLIGLDNPRFLWTNFHNFGLSGDRLQFWVQVRELVQQVVVVATLQSTGRYHLWNGHWAIGVLRLCNPTSQWMSNNSGLDRLSKKQFVHFSSQWGQVLRIPPH